MPRIFGFARWAILRSIWVDYILCIIGISTMDIVRRVWRVS